MVAAGENDEACDGEDLGRKLRVGESGQGGIREAISVLLDEVTAHNASEEKLLEPVLEAGGVCAGARGPQA